MKTIRQIIYGVVAMLIFKCDVTAQKQWLTVGTAGFSAGAADYTSLAIDKNGTEYVVYTDAANSNKATVMYFDGKNWIIVGTPGFSAGAAYATSIAIDNNGTPYVVYQDSVNSAKATVMKYNGTSWVVVGTVGLSVGAVHETKIAIDNGGTPYIAYRDSANGAKATVMKYDGTNWSFVGSVGFTVGSVTKLTFAIDGKGTPYVAYTDLSANNAGYVMKYDGLSWVVVHYYANAPFSSAGIAFANIAIGKNDTPYVAYYYPGSYPYVKKFNSVSWVTVGYSPFTPNIKYLAIDSNGTPYVAVQDTAYGGKMSVMKFDGTAWVYAGNRGFTSDTFSHVSMTFDNYNILKVAYRDAGNSNKITVMEYGCPAISKLGICAVTTDTAINGNIVMTWDDSLVSGFADSFMIYREDNGNYSKIATVYALTNTFTDVTTLPSVQSYRYKLTYIDKCGREMLLDSSVAHRTIHLAFNYLRDGNASITWNSYEGIANPVYTIKRSNNGGVFTAISSFAVSGVDTTYIDVNPPAGSNRYLIEIPLANSCNLGGVTSNIVSAWNTGINDIDEHVIKVYPNPAHDILKISASENLAKIEVINIQGRKILSESIISGHEAILDISNLPEGLYLLRINDVHKSTFTRQ